MIITKYTESDYEQTLELIIEFQDYLAEIDTKKQVKAFDSRDDAKKYLDQLIRDTVEREGAFYLAKQDDEIVGFIQGIIDRNQDNVLYTLTHHNPGAYGWIGVLYIKPNHRGSGISRQLVDKITTHFKSNNCISVRLLVMADNALARSAYTHLGFAERDLELSKDL
jgi:ribosomal protein S18 acetylase RimI-like enzyme